MFKLLHWAALSNFYIHRCRRKISPESHGGDKFSAFNSFLVATSSAAQHGIILRTGVSNVDVNQPEFMLHPIIFFQSAHSDWKSPTKRKILQIEITATTQSYGQNS